MTGLRRFLPRYTLRTLAIFLLLATCVEALWLHWEPWVRDGSLKLKNLDGLRLPRMETICMLGFEGDIVVGLSPEPCRPDRTYITFRHIALCNIRSRIEVEHTVIGTETVSRKDSSDFLIDHMSHDDGRTISYDENVMGTILDSNGGDVVVVDSATKRVLARLGSFSIAPTSFTSDGNGIVMMDRWTIRFFRRYRPEWWWGVFYLKEFWATVFFAAFLAWSIRGDRRYFRKLDAEYAAERAAKAAGKAQATSGSGEGR